MGIKTGTPSPYLAATGRNACRTLKAHHWRTRRRIVESAVPGGAFLTLARNSRRTRPPVSIWVRGSLDLALLWTLHRPVPPVERDVSDRSLLAARPDRSRAALPPQAAGSNGRRLRRCLWSTGARVGVWACGGGQPQSTTINDDHLRGRLGLTGVDFRNHPETTPTQKNRFLSSAIGYNVGYAWLAENPEWQMTPPRLRRIGGRRQGSAWARGGSSASSCRPITSRR